jgi:hypothetical protein
MNKYALLCAVVIAAPVLAEVDRSADRRGKELAADVVKATLRSGEEDAEATRSSCCKCKSSCSKCCKSCSSCSKCCGCKSAPMNEEATKCACGTDKPENRSEVSEDEKDKKELEEGTAETRKCSSCGCSCGKCGCH